jgi:hypothetical protein
MALFSLSKTAFRPHFVFQNRVLPVNQMVRAEKTKRNRCQKFVAGGMPRLAPPHTTSSGSTFEFAFENGCGCGFRGVALPRGKPAPAGSGYLSMSCAVITLFCAGFGLDCAAFRQKCAPTSVDRRIKRVDNREAEGKKKENAKRNFPYSMKTHIRQVHPRQ